MSRLRRDRQQMRTLVLVLGMAIIETYYSIALSARDFGKPRDLDSPRTAFLAVGEAHEVIGGWDDRAQDWSEAWDECGC